MKNKNPLITMNHLLKLMHTPKYILKKVTLLVLALFSYWPNVFANAWNMVEILYVYYSLMFLFFVFSLEDDLNILSRAWHCLMEVFRESP